MNTNKRTIAVLTIFTLFASILAFNTVSAASSPSVTTGSANMISSRNVSLNASINPNGLYTQVWFQIDTNNPPNTARGHQGIGSGASSVNVQAGIINLLLDTTYYYRAVAQNSNGTVFGELRSFTTSSDGGTSASGSTSGSSGTVTSGNTSTYGSSTSGPTAPLVETNGPASVSATSAVINGSINPNNADTKFWFEFGLTYSFGKKTSIEPAGSGNTWTLVTGNLSGLETGRTYYYRVVAQNNFGTAIGDTMNFTTSTSGSNTNTSGSGQVSGATTTGSVGSATNSGGAVAGATSTGTGDSLVSSSNPADIRPSFISLEYSLADNGALVVVADDIRPGPGDDFTYTIVYKNDSASAFNESKLKVIIPIEAYFVDSNIEPLEISGSIVEFDLGDIKPGEQGAVVVVSRIRDEVASETNLIFTSVLTYKDRLGVQLATTSYLTTKTSRSDAVLSASFLGAIFGSSAMLILIALGLLILMAILTYTMVKVRKRNEKNNKKASHTRDEFVLDNIPSTFEPIDTIEK